MAGRIFLAILLAAIVGAGLFVYGVYLGKIAVPDEWNPWTPLDVREPPGPLTDWKLWRATHDPQRCLAVLERSQTSFRPVPDAVSPNGCRLDHAVRVERMQAGFSSSFLASCPLAVGMALFDRQYLQPAAQAAYGQSVARIEHVGSYACRNVNHAQAGSLSEHASANALDITGFVLANGRRITIERDWKGDSAASLFLHRVHGGACAVFHTTLSPDYNALHATHFHVDMGKYRLCR